MIVVDSRFGKIVSSVAVFLTAQLSLPYGIATFLPRGGPHPVHAAKQKPRASRTLADAEMSRMSGRLDQCPFLAGSNKWSIDYKGVDVYTGNFTTSATDLTFEGGYGVPVNVTRSYSANNPDEGPFGVGWSLSADIRTTAGGLLKSNSAPIRSTPNNIQERPSTQSDPNVSTQPVEAVTASDAGGKVETVQRDVDGVLSTPPWDKNIMDSQYQLITFGNAVYQILASETVSTPDGTVYTYQVEGSYPSGEVPYYNPNATPEPSNILKVVSATDRNGNVTNYTYSGNPVTFNTANGGVSETPLHTVAMPNGHTITFTWGTGAIGQPPTNRIATVSDGTRTVTYAYSNGNLISVTSPAGKLTVYGYGGAFGGNGVYLTSITDPRGIGTGITYTCACLIGGTPPYYVPVNTVIAYKVVATNGVQTRFHPPLAAAVLGGSLPTDYSMVDYEVSPDSQGDFFDVLQSGGTFTPLDFFQIPGGVQTQAPPTPTYQSPAFARHLIVATGTPSGGLVADMFQNSWYSPFTQDLLAQSTYTIAFAYNPAQADLATPCVPRAQNTSTTYNFMGQPLSKTLTFFNTINNNGSWNSEPGNTQVVSYAYWDATKYYQQRAVRDNAGRYSYTDYWDSSAAQGRKGQTHWVYSQAFTSWDGLGTNWKYNIVPHSPNNYSAQFDYDAKGRPTDVLKLQNASAPPFSYVHTTTAYGADNDGSWGAARSVVEDAGGINRTTQTLAYDSIGRAIEVQDASGKIFSTSYDLDGVIQNVYRTDNGLNQPIVLYTYGTSGTSLGQPTQIQDGLSGVTQNIAYYPATGGGAGQPQSVSEQNGSDLYSTAYTYSAAGDRATASYATPAGTVNWGYSNYTTVGVAPNVSRVFCTLNRLDGSFNPTAEQFDYQYDPQGRLRQAAFAQTPQAGQSGYQTYPAGSRARAWYDYDTLGRLVTLNHWWDVMQSNGTYASTAVLGNTCAYDPALGLKTSSSFWVQNPQNTSQFLLQRTETFGYDPNLDYLTSASYNDGLPNANPIWSYDAAGNRTDSVCDNLNRATSIGGVSCTSDILGNRLTCGSTTYSWDADGRMASLNGNTYSYRPDGLRASKTVGPVTTRYRYDGQMGMEDSDSTGVVRRYGLGARGIDFIENPAGSGGWVAFPVYDGHGNMVALLGRSANSSYTLGNERSFDAWGTVRVGAPTGDPSSRYCAKLGHRQDDESGLVYMRARYYEPASGRFISEDMGKNGGNWFDYCSGDPVNNCDATGRRSQHLDRFSEALYDALVELFVTEGFINLLGGGVCAITGAILGICGVEWLALPLFVGGLCAVAFGLMSLVYADYAADTIVNAVDVLRQSGGFAPSAGLTALGDAGIMLAGLGMGLQPDDDDAWVWGF